LENRIWGSAEDMKLVINTLLSYIKKPKFCCDMVKTNIIKQI